MSPVADTEQTLAVNSLAELPAAAQTFATFLGQNPGVSVVIFEGDMGAGKTTFIKAVCRELGVTDAVSSPTFSIVNEYETISGKREDIMGSDGITVNLNMSFLYQLSSNGGLRLTFAGPFERNDVQPSGLGRKGFSMLNYEYLF